MTRRKPSAALVISCLALVVASAGTGVAATPIVKRALFADNAGKLGGKTLSQVAARPGPASSAADAVSIRTSTETLTAQQQKALKVRCSGGERVVGGGWTSSSPLLGTNTHPSAADEWEVELVNLVSGSATVTLYALCVR